MNLMRPVLAFLGLCLVAGMAFGSPAQREVPFDVPAQPLNVALNAFAQQAGLKIVFNTGEVGTAISRPVKGNLTPERALKLLLQNLNLVYEFVDETTVAITPPKHQVSAVPPLTRVAQNGPPAPVKDEARTARDAGNDDNEKGVPEILVKGSRSINTDIRRSEDDPQPYVIFDSEEIQRSQAGNLDEFLRTRLPMNTVSAGNGQSAGGSDPTSSVNLRGLGANQTLILVDGRRMPGVTSFGNPFQADLNGIPLSAVERVEVLPSTAGGIYGGSATGGVVNIILRRDFRGLEAKVGYTNTFDTDTGAMRLDASTGFSFEGGRTQVMIAASHSDANNLVVGDRDFAARAIALQLLNNRGAIVNSTTPPLGATANIRSVSGNLVLDAAYGGAPLISSATGQPTNITYLPLGYAGPASDGGAALRANAGQYNLELPGGMNGRDRGLLVAPAVESLSLNLRREMSSRVDVFLDLSTLANDGSSFVAGVPNASTNLPASAPNNPFQQNINVRFPTGHLGFEAKRRTGTLRGTGGVIVRLPHRWTGEVDYGWSRSRFRATDTSFAVDNSAQTSLNTGLSVNGRPALNALQEDNAFPIDFGPYLLPSPNYFGGPFETVLKDVTLRMSGPALDLPGGALNLSALVERRSEVIQDATHQTIDPATAAPVYLFFPHRSQDIDSYYLEARAPLISSQLELQVSVRRDEYATTSDGSTGLSVTSRNGPFPAVNYSTGRIEASGYTLGLRYTPLEAVTLRASLGTGFLPPSVTQIAATQGPLGFNLGTDPKRGNTGMYVGVPFTFISGGNPSLSPEESESWSVGTIFTPRLAPGLRLSLDYTRIEKIDEIQPPAFQFILDNEDVLPGRIQRGARLAGDPVGWSGPITSFDTTLMNIAKTSVDAYDIQADYTVESEHLGGFHWYALATWQPHYRNQLLPTAAVVDRVGFSGGLLEWRGNMGLDWERGALTLGWNAQYYHSYFVHTATATAAAITTARLNQGSSTIPRQLYHDLIVTYRFDRILPDAELSFGIQNLFDESPPILASTVTTNPGYSTYGDPRLRRYSISLRKSFQ